MERPVIFSLGTPLNVLSPTLNGALLPLMGLPLDSTRRPCSLDRREERL